MKKWVWAAIVLVILGAAGVGGYFLGQRGQNSDQSKTTIKELTSQITTLQDKLKIVQTDLSLVNPLIQNHINAVASVVTAIQPAVVRINVSGDGFQALGSGFIVRSDGYVVTNQHVIDSAKSISVTLLNGNQIDAQVSAADKGRDLALLKLKSSRTDYPVAPVGISSNVTVGDDAVACGFPLGFDLPGPASFTRGIISAVRDLNGLSFLQTDCEVDPGSSGGCLVNLDCQVVGVTSDAVLPPKTELNAIALAIPSNDLLAFLQSKLK